MTSRKVSAKSETAKTAETVKAAAKAPAKTVAKASAKTETKTAAKAPAKTAARKTASKASKAAPQAEVVIEFGGRQIVAKEILEAAKKDFAEKHEGAELKSIHLYIKPEESVAYYVVNDGIGDPEDKVEF